MWLILQALCFGWFAMGWWPCEVPCPIKICSLCDDETTPLTWEVEMSDVDDGPTCEECDTLNTTTYVLRHVSPGLNGEPPDCGWSFFMPNVAETGGLCRGNYCGFGITHHPSYPIGTSRINFRIYQTSLLPYGWPPPWNPCRSTSAYGANIDGLGTSWLEEGPDHDCMTAFTDLEITGSNQFTYRCDFSSATVTLTPIGWPEE